MLASLLALGVVSGCATSLKVADTGSIREIAIPAKDFQVVGVVRHEAVVSNGNGERLTYDALMKAAAAQGANGLVNVMIDVSREQTSFLFFSWNVKETWYGSALAIRYLNANLPPNTPMSDGTQVLQPTGGLLPSW